jgi:potassium-transporting ATPase potassium-binding subunit
MKTFALLQIVFLFLSLFILIPVMGHYILWVFKGECPKWLRKWDILILRACGMTLPLEMTWWQYAKALLVFNAIGFLVLFALLSFQGVLPLNPQELPSLSWPLALNISMSFVTNTNWQSYTPETTLSYFSQMSGLTTQNFLSAATGLTVFFALIRGIVRKSTDTIGNFWIDMIRLVLYFFLPLSILLAAILVSQGVIQTFNPYVKAQTLENQTQIIPLGPVASQVAIKQLGSNGGGFFNANSAHPFENPTPLSNFFELLAILMIPAASTYCYGILINSKKQGWIILGVMLFFLFTGLAIAFYSELLINPNFEERSFMEGKETRFGLINSVLWSVSTTATSNGSTNTSMTALSPIASGVSLFNMMLGEIILGGVGLGICGMILFSILTVFLAGLMVGRTPEYIGKKIEKKEIQFVMIALLLPSTIILFGSGLVLLNPEGFRHPTELGPHGLTEILYMLASTTANNGSAFTSLNTNTDFFNLLLSFTMLIGRLSVIIPTLAIAGSLASKNILSQSEASFETDSFQFAILLASVILIVGGLIFFPALVLGPVMEHFLMLMGRTF